MRIIAGRFRRRTLQSPGGKGTRPTTDRAREAIYNLVAARLDLEGARVLDLFAGTGALGLEGLSRGAASLVCIDNSRVALEIAKSNARSLDPSLDVSFILSDVTNWLSRAKPDSFDLILADPPYTSESVLELPEKVIPLLSENGFFFLEHDRKVRFNPSEVLLETRTYGKSAVSIFTTPHQE